MRGRQAMKNITANLLLQLITAASGLVLPRFYLLAYGSAMNGMVSSVSQFMSYLMLVEAGVGSASAVALYGPLARQDKTSINGILSAASQFYRRSGLIYLALVLGLTFGYPLLLHGQVDERITMAIILILSFSNLVDYFFLGKYRVLLNADQHGYVVTFIQCLGMVVNTGVSIGLILAGFNIAVVRGTATFVYVLRTLLVYGYVKRHYPYLDFHAAPDREPLRQRWSVLLHQVVGIVVNNTDLVLLTLFLRAGSMLEISVYSIYNMVAYNISNVVSSFSNSLGSGFGELFARDEQETLKKAYNTYEYLYDICVFFCYTCMGGLLAAFVRIYTGSITDVEYLRLSLVILFPVIGLLQNIRIPGLTMICAAGHYEETRTRALAEAGINLAVSILLVRPFGIVGVLLGTLVSYSYRSFDVIFYNSRYLVKGVVPMSLKRLVRNGLVSLFLVLLWHWVPLVRVTGIFSWLLCACVYGSLALAVFLTVNGLCEPQEFKAALERILGILHRGRVSDRAEEAARTETGEEECL